MSYSKNIWADRDVQFPHRYKDQNNNQLTLTRDEGTVNAAGTLINAAKMNNLESGLKNVDNAVRYIVATAAANGDFKINIDTPIETNMIINISFPTATNISSNARLSIDNGANYKNIKNSIGTQLLAAAVQNRLVVFCYDGTDFKKIFINDILNDGWTNPNEVWAYASATTITVPSGAVSKYKKGDKIKLTQTDTVKYFYIIGVADTVITVTGGSDYTIANDAITNNYYSHQETPIGFPEFFNTANPVFNTTLIDNGTTGQQPVIVRSFFKVLNDNVKLKVNLGTAQKNGAGKTFSFTIPSTLPQTTADGLECLGYFYIGGADGLGVAIRKSATEIYGLSSTSIADDTPMPSTSLDISYRY